MKLVKTLVLGVFSLTLVFCISAFASQEPTKKSKRAKSQTVACNIPLKPNPFNGVSVATKYTPAGATEPVFKEVRTGYPKHTTLDGVSVSDPALFRSYILIRLGTEIKEVLEAFHFRASESASPIALAAKLEKTTAEMRVLADDHDLLMHGSEDLGSALFLTEMLARNIRAHSGKEMKPASLGYLLESRNKSKRRITDINVVRQRIYDGGVPLNIDFVVGDFLKDTNLSEGRAPTAGGSGVQVVPGIIVDRIRGKVYVQLSLNAGPPVLKPVAFDLSAQVSIDGLAGLKPSRIYGTAANENTIPDGSSNVFTKAVVDADSEKSVSSVVLEYDLPALKTNTNVPFPAFVKKHQISTSKGVLYVNGDDSTYRAFQVQDAIAFTHGGMKGTGILKVIKKARAGVTVEMELRSLNGAALSTGAVLLFKSATPQDFASIKTFRAVEPARKKTLEEEYADGDFIIR